MFARSTVVERLGRKFTRNCTATVRMRRTYLVGWRTAMSSNVSQAAPSAQVRSGASESANRPAQAATPAAVEVHYTPRNLLRALGVASAWALSFTPMVTGWIRCTFAQLLHLPCPGCGMTRAALLLLNGHPLDSLRMNPLTVPSAFAQLGLVATFIWLVARDGQPVRFWHYRITRALTYLLFASLAAAILVWIARFFGALGGPVPI
jgi:Protein of unknown function (DUF2752)